MDILDVTLQKNETFLKSTNPQRESILEFENWLSPLIDQIRADRAAGRNIQAAYNIPVVIHIIHNGDCLGTGRKYHRHISNFCKLMY